MKNRILQIEITALLLILVGCSKENGIIPAVESTPIASVSKNTTPLIPSSSNEIIPWGVARIGGGINATDKTAWIIDSGIELTHPDLNVDLLRSISFVENNPSPTDEYGHGTNVAGIIAAIKGNEIGVVGVAAGAKVVSVRVLDKNGNGTIAAMLAGIEYVSTNGRAGDVANISFEVGSCTAIDEAVLAASLKGIRFVIAAGNGAVKVSSSPARINGANIYTVAAMDQQDRFASFSNFGTTIVDYCAPGVDIYSTAIGGGYSMMSGTSMAAPHLAGLLLIGTIQSCGNAKEDPEGLGEPIAHH